MKYRMRYTGSRFLVFVAYFPLIWLFIFIFTFTFLLFGEITSKVLNIKQLEFFIVKSLVLPAIYFIIFSLLVSIIINIYFFVKIWRSRHIAESQRKSLLYLFFKLPIFSSCFYVDVFISRNQYTKYLAYLNSIRNILLRNIVLQIANKTSSFFYTDLSPIESLVINNKKIMRRYVFLLLLFITINLFLSVMYLSISSKNINILFAETLSFIIIIVFLIVCIIYYTKLHK